MTYPLWHGMTRGMCVWFAITSIAIVVGCGPQETTTPSKSASPDNSPANAEIRQPPDGLDTGGEASIGTSAESTVQHDLGDNPATADGTPSRETLFEGWPEPLFVFFVTGRQHGYIEPCGCTGLTNQKGGLVRRFTFKKQLEDRGWNVIAVDVGDQVRRFGRQPEIKYQMTIEGMKQMGYQAIGFGPDDLRLSIDELFALVAGDGESQGPLMCANAAVLDPSITPRFRVVEAGGRKVGLTAVLSEDFQQRIQSDEIVKQPVADAMKEVCAALSEAACDVKLLLAHASIEDTQKIAQQFPEFDIVVTAGGAGEPTFEAEPIPETKSLMVRVGTKAMYVGVVGVFDDPEQPFRYQRVPLDARFDDSQEMLDLLASYQQQLEELGLEELGIRPIPHPSDYTYVGSAACQECHAEEYDVWTETPHSWALDSLIEPGERSEIPRHFDPECISCHVTGWNPQNYFPYKSGYLGVDETPLMHHVGCENCHGPGSKHVAAEEGDIEVFGEAMDKLREEMVLPLEKAREHCIECHDLDNSPDFHAKGAFEEYWEQIKH